MQRRLTSVGEDALMALRDHPGSRVLEIQTRVGASDSMIAKALGSCLRSGLVRIDGLRPGFRGRPATTYSLTDRGIRYLDEIERHHRALDALEKEMESDEQ